MIVVIDDTHHRHRHHQSDKALYGNIVQAVLVKMITSMTMHVMAIMITVWLMCAMILEGWDDDE